MKGRTILEITEAIERAGGLSAVLRRTLGAALAAGLAAAPTLLAAQTPAPASKAALANADAEDEEVSEIVVTGARTEQGAVLGDIKPEIQLSPADIQSYGVSSVSDLLDEIAPQTRSARGDDGPVILLNGRRISSFFEIRDLPTEAILRVDILPEEAALKFGYSADQRVVNIVLRRRFRAITAEVEAGGPTAGGQMSGEVDVDHVRIRGDNRLTVNLNYQAANALTEDERDLTSSTTSQLYDLVGNVSPAAFGGEIDPALSALAGRRVTIAGVPAGAAGRRLTLADFAATAGVANTSDVRRYRSLLPSTREASANVVYARTLPWGISASFNARLGVSSSDSLQGLPSLTLTVPRGDPFSPFGSDVRVARYVDGLGPMQRSVDTWTAHLGTTLNRNAGRWRLSLTGAYDHGDTLTVGDAGVDTTVLQALLLAASPGADPFSSLPLGLTPARPHDKARSISDGANFQFVASGPLFTAPAGPVNASFKAGDAQSWFNTTSFRRGVTQAAQLSRNDFNAQVNFDLPLASRKANFLPAVGELSLNLNAALHQLSDFGGLTTLGYGANWTPFTGLNLTVSRTTDESAPSVQQLGNPLVVTPGSRILDFRTGQTVDVNRIDGASPGLTESHRDVLKFGLTLKPLPKQDFVVTASYVVTRVRNPIQTFPAATADIEAAFPDRFLRDANGVLVQVDYRPVNFARQDRREFRWGFNYSRAIGRPPTPPPPPADALRRQRPRGEGANGPPGNGQIPNGQGRNRPGQNAPGPGAAAAPADGAPSTTGAPPASTAQAQAGGRGGGDGRPRGGGGGPGGGFGGGGGGGGPGGGGPGGGGFGGGGGRGGGFGGGGGPQGGRLQLAIYHTVFFENRLLVRPGGPLLDLLNGSAAGNGGGQARHQVEAQAGYSKDGLGLRFSANWRSGTFVRGGGGGLSSSDLTFSGLTTVNLRLFANLGNMPSLVQHRPWLRGSRVTLSLNNLFDQRVLVRDANGVTPLSYQPDYLDPSGRTVRLSVRKVF
ncbi:MAG: TonB-dependent receptor [Caulobacteraceae bacterium]